MDLSRGIFTAPAGCLIGVTENKHIACHNALLQGVQFGTLFKALKPVMMLLITMISLDESAALKDSGILAQRSDPTLRAWDVTKPDAVCCSNIRLFPFGVPQGRAGVLPARVDEADTLLFPSRPLVKFADQPYALSQIP